MDFTHSTWFETEVSGVEFHGCNFGFLDFRAVKFTRVLFVDCDLVDTSIDTDGSTFDDVEMRNCQLGTGAQFLDRAGIRIS